MDLADSPEASYEHHPVEDMEPLAESASAAADFYRRLVLLFQTSRNAKFTAVCYLIATGDADADGVSMTDVAKEWGVTKAAVSKHCVEVCVFLGVPPSRYMRDQASKVNFQQSNRRNQKAA